MKDWANSSKGREELYKLYAYIVDYNAKKGNSAAIKSANFIYAGETLYLPKLYAGVDTEYKLNENALPKFDTGGYTGEWGANGRLAMLHEKELVLNKTDTKNILDAVSIVREIGESIKKSVYANAGATASFLGRVSTVRFNEKPHEIQ
jgi:hypothetical protein